MFRPRSGRPRQCPPPPPQQFFGEQLRRFLYCHQAKLPSFPRAVSGTAFGSVNSAVGQRRTPHSAFECKGRHARYRFLFFFSTYFARRWWAFCARLARISVTVTRGVILRASVIVGFFFFFFFFFFDHGDGDVTKSRLSRASWLHCKLVMPITSMPPPPQLRRPLDSAFVERPVSLHAEDRFRLCNPPIGRRRRRTRRPYFRKPADTRVAWKLMCATIPSPKNVETRPARYDRKN